MFIITQTDEKGKKSVHKYKTFSYALRKLLYCVFYPPQGDYKIMFLRQRNDEEKNERQAK